MKFQVIGTTYKTLRHVSKTVDSTFSTYDQAADYWKELMIFNDVVRVEMKFLEDSDQ